MSACDFPNSAGLGGEVISFSPRARWKARKIKYTQQGRRCCRGGFKAVGRKQSETARAAELRTTGVVERRCRTIETRVAREKFKGWREGARKKIVECDAAEEATKIYSSLARHGTHSHSRPSASLPAVMRWFGDGQSAPSLASLLDFACETNLTAGKFQFPQRTSAFLRSRPPLLVSV